MKNSKYISLILTFIGMITLARTSNAQGKIAAGTATISVTVVRGTGVSFSPSKSVDKSLSGRHEQRCSVGIGDNAAQHKQCHGTVQLLGWECQLTDEFSSR